MATKSVECQLSFFEHLLFSNIFWGELLLKGNFFCKWSHFIKKIFFEKCYVTHNLMPPIWPRGGHIVPPLSHICAYLCKYA